MNNNSDNKYSNFFPINQVDIKKLNSSKIEDKQVFTSDKNTLIKPTNDRWSNDYKEDSISNQSSPTFLGMPRKIGIFVTIGVGLLFVGLTTFLILRKKK